MNETEIAEIESGETPAEKENTDPFAHVGEERLPGMTEGEEDRTPAEEAGARAVLAGWRAEAEALAQRVLGFDLALEAKNETFRSLLRTGLPVERAWAAVHWEELLSGAVHAAASLTEKRVVDNLRARGLRPAEAGLGAQSAAPARTDVSRLSKKDRADIARRVAMGERVTF